MTKRVANPKTVNGHSALPMPERFWSHVSEPDERGCRLWTGYRDPRTGHGRFTHVFGTTVASRIAYQLTYGPVPKTVLICHTCDVGSCVEPTHLYAGSQLSNMRDRKQRGDGYRGAGRRLRGERHWLTTLTQQQADAIRELAADRSISQSAIGRMFGVSQSVVSNIHLGKTWTGHS